MTEPGLAAGPPASAPALRVVSLTRHFGSTKALDSVSLTVRRGTVHALLGGNGSGKSTLIKIVAGVVRAEAGGRIDAGSTSYDVKQWDPVLARAAGLRFVHQNPGIFPGMSVAENLAVGAQYVRRVTGNIDWAAQHRQTAEVLQRFRIAARPSDDVGRLGPATRTMIAIARALQDRWDARSGVLMLDEPTASLPRSEVVMLLQALRHYASLGQTIVLVSHRLDEVLEVADTVTVLRDGCEVVTQPIAGLTKRDLARQIAGHEVKTVRPGPQAAAIGPELPRVKVRGLVAGPLRGADLDLLPGQVLGVAGLLGSGRTTLLRSLFGLVQHEAGTISIDGHPVVLRNPGDAIRRGLVYVPEERVTATFATLSVQSNLSVPRIGDYWRRLRFQHGAEARDARSAISAFGVRCASERALITSLSGGNQQKAVLARWLQLKPRILLLDEPTQGVDVGARFDIFHLIRETVATGSSVIVVSSDFEELIEICDQIVVLTGGRLLEQIAASELTAARLLESAFGRDDAG